MDELNNIHKRNKSLRTLPAVGILLERPDIKAAIERYGRKPVTEVLQGQIQEARALILAGETPEFDIPATALQRLAYRLRPRMRRVLNATGTILNTNLGRAPLAQAAVEQISKIAEGYSNLEYDLDRGERGNRHELVESLLVDLTGAEAALVVNNNAATVLLVIATLATGKEVVVSRGQLIEIGGSFRLPEVIEAAGGILVEVGTTNKTHPEDYQKAVSPETSLLLRSHTSNYKIIGFTEEVDAITLARIAQETNIISYEDIGSGALLDLSRFGLPHEPLIQDSLRGGIDLVSFSGDKLLGGPQAGILVGKKALVDRLKRNPLMRALRPGKLTLAALEATLRLYLSPESIERELPLYRAVQTPLKEIEARAEKIIKNLRKLGFEVETVPGTSTVGGGSLPGVELKTVLAAVAPGGPVSSINRLAEALRQGDPPLVARVEHDRFLIDPRTLLPGEDQRLIECFKKTIG